MQKIAVNETAKDYSNTLSEVLASYMILTYITQILNKLVQKNTVRYISYYFVEKIKCLKYERIFVSDIIIHYIMR